VTEKEQINKTLLEDYGITGTGPRALLTVYICGLIETEREACLNIMKIGSRIEEGLTDHVFRGGSSHILICSCGLHRDQHPHRAKTREKIMKEIRARGKEEGKRQK